MVRNFHEDLKSRWFLVDVVEGFVVILVGFILLLGKFLHPPIPFLFYFIKGPVDVSFDLSLFAGVIILFLSFSLVFGDFSIGRGRGGGGRERGCGFPVFESSLIGDANW